jgi:ATP-dependent Clp protease ATP-binding subunit ClpA
MAERVDYSRITDRARRVFSLANQEAQRFGHDWIGIGHLLIALYREGSGIAAHVLKDIGIVDLVTLRAAHEKIEPSGPALATVGKMPQTPRVKDCVEQAYREAMELGHNYVGTEHILLGVASQPEGPAATMFESLGVSRVAIRAEVMRLLSVDSAATSDAAGPITIPLDQPPPSEEGWYFWEGLEYFDSVPQVRPIYVDSPELLRQSKKYMKARWSRRLLVKVD